MPARRVFLGIQRPALAAACDFLSNEYCREAVADLSNVVVVVPTSRAGRRFRQLLVHTTQQRELALLPPRIVTVGRVPELLYRPKRPLATPWLQQLAWAKAIEELDSDARRRLAPRLAPRLDANAPKPISTRERVDVGELFAARYRELAAEGLSFADVANARAHLDGFPEADRWTDMAILQETYLHLLDRLERWDQQTARLVAVRRRECHTNKDIVLLATSDINRTLREMLEQVADHVIVLIHAPSEWADRFDQLGCLVPTAWRDVHIGFEDALWTIAEDPADQAAEVVEQLRLLNATYAARQITIGCAEQRWIPYIHRALSSAGVTSRFGPGRTVLQSGPFTLLAAFANWLHTGSAATFAQLARHPDVNRWLDSRKVSPDWLEELDEWMMTRLPATVRGPDDVSGARRQLSRACGCLKKLCEPLAVDCRSVAEWAGPVQVLLRTVYGNRQASLTDSSQRMMLAACAELQAALSAMSQLPPLLCPSLSAAEAIELLLHQVADTDLPELVVPDAIELLGWLELPLDDAPVVIVTGMNEGVVPGSVTSDLFLPNTLRQHLGIDDNERRYARDAYALSVLLASRGYVHMISGRRDADGNPLKPSRLLFAADDETICRRWLRVTDTARSSVRVLAVASTTGQSGPGFGIPRPAPLTKPFTRIRVTDFRDYLACPYRFYLRHILNLKAVDDWVFEMDGKVFGGFVHAVLQRFGLDGGGDLTDADEIRHQLRRLQAELARQQFGARPLPAVRIQLEQARLRLDAFAHVQAKHAAAGWRIEAVEIPDRKNPVEWMIDEEPILLSGRIDRIDRHRETGEYLLLDYKTSDAVKRPEAAHQNNKKKWIDLQLPLYRRLAQALGINGRIQLGFVLLPGNTETIQFAVANWTDSDLAEAEATACDVVRRIRRSEFWPPREPAPQYSDMWNDICMVGLREAPSRGSAT